MAARDFSVEEPDQVIPPTSRKIYVALDENGCRIGETHFNAKLTDHEVDLIRELREVDGLTYDTLAEKFECSKAAIQKICNYSRRASTPARYKVVVLHFLNPPNEGEKSNERTNHQTGAGASARPDRRATSRTAGNRSAGLRQDADRVLAYAEV